MVLPDVARRLQGWCLAARRMGSCLGARHPASAPSELERPGRRSGLPKVLGDDLPRDSVRAMIPSWLPAIEPLLRDGVPRAALRNDASRSAPRA